MQTFLPYPSVIRSAACLDWRRLGNQRNEASIILRALVDGTDAWQHHPVTNMWRGYENALIVYRNSIIKEWVRRGYKNSLPLLPHGKVVAPPWYGDNRLHSSHRAALLRKDPEYYGRYGWREDPNMPAWYPPDSISRRR